MTDIDRAVSAAVSELNRQSHEGRPGPYSYGDASRPHAFGIDGEVDLVSLVRVVKDALDAAIPREPTPAMLDAGLIHMDSGYDDLRLIWARMLDAAQNPPKQE